MQHRLPLLGAGVQTCRCYNGFTMQDNAQDSVSVRFALPFPVHISSEPICADVRGMKCTVLFEKVKREHVDPRLGGSGGDFDLPEDRYGWVRYSVATVHVPSRQLSPPPLVVEKDEWLLQIAIDAVNAFLGHYREMMNLPWLRQVSTRDVSMVEVSGISRACPLPGLSLSLRTGVCLPIIGISAEREQIIRRRLQESRQPSPWKLLLLDARESLARGDTRLAVIVGQIAIEGAICDGLARKCRELQVRLTDVRKQLNEERILSYEDAISRANFWFKFTDGLKMVGLGGVDEDPALHCALDAANTMRVACVHYGTIPSPKEAERAVDTYHRVYREYLEQLLPGDGALRNRDCVEESSDAVAQALGRQPSDALRGVIEEELPVLGKKLVLQHISRLPMHLDRRNRRHTLVQAQTQGDALLVWLDPKRDVSHNEMLIAEALTYFARLFCGYPYAMAADKLPFEEGRLGWEHIADTLTQAILGLHVTEHLRKKGFDLAERAMQRLRATMDRVSKPDYREPQPEEAATKAFPLEITELYWSLESDSARQDLLGIVKGQVPSCAQEVGRLIEVVRRGRFSSQEDCVELMVACRNSLRLRDSCLVIDPRKRLVHRSRGATSY